MSTRNAAYAQLGGLDKLLFRRAAAGAKDPVLARRRSAPRACWPMWADRVDPAFEKVQERVTVARKTVTGRTATASMTPRGCRHEERRRAAKKAPAKRRRLAAATAPAKKAAATTAPARGCGEEGSGHESRRRLAHGPSSIDPSCRRVMAYRVDLAFRDLVCVTRRRGPSTGSGCGSTGSGCGERAQGSFKGAEVGQPAFLARRRKNRRARWRPG